MQVGAFPHYGGRWAEWNGYFRDTVRQFIKGTDGDFIGAFASCMLGSPEVYEKEQAPDGDWWGHNGGAKWRGGRSPMHCVNFVTAHDGFTLADLVSYSEKHNEANGEDNMDGAHLSALLLNQSLMRSLQPVCVLLVCDRLATTLAVSIVAQLAGAAFKKTFTSEM